MIMKKLVPILAIAFLAGCASSSGSNSVPSLPSTIYIANSEGSKLAADMSPGQRLSYLNQGMTKAQVIAVMGIAHGASTYPPSFDCLDWQYLENHNSSYRPLVAATVIFYKGNLVSTNQGKSGQSSMIGCAYELTPSKAKLLSESMVSSVDGATGSETRSSASDERLSNAITLQTLKPIYEAMKQELASNPKDSKLKAGVADMKKQIDELTAKMSKSK